MHRRIPRFKLFKNFSPDYVADNIRDIDYSALRTAGIKAIAFDVDSTIATHAAETIDKKSADFLRSLPLPIFLATNRTGTTANLIGAQVEAVGVVHAEGASRKPSKSYFSKLETLSGIKMSDFVMIGDRLFTDVLGGNSSGAMTIYVKSIGKDPSYISIFRVRWLEQLVIRLLSRSAAQ